MDASQNVVRSSHWAGFTWSSWLPLDPEAHDHAEIPATAGLYRVRHTRREGLEYVGQTGRKLRERIQQLARTTYQDKQPGNAPHTAAPALWRLQNETKGRLEVSYTNPNIVRSELDRIGIEYALNALHIRKHGVSPAVNLDREHVLESLQERQERHTDLQDIRWGLDDMLSRDLLGLHWTAARALSYRLAIDADQGVYRIWFPDYAPPLAYIGKSTQLLARLREHEKKFGSEALFSVVPTSTSLKELEHLLLGRHYLTTHTLPKGQEGRRNRFEMEFKQQ